MKRYAVYGHGYNPLIPACFVFAISLAEAWEQARIALEGRAFVSGVVESPLLEE